MDGASRWRWAMISVLALPVAAAGSLPMSHHDGQCIDGGSDATLTVHIPPEQAGVTSFSWPPLPDAGSPAFSFVLPKALVALAPGCVASAGVAANADNGPGTSRNLWLGRFDELPRAPALDACGCGAAIFVGGSGGNTGDNLRMMRHLAANGYTTIAPDTMAGAPSGAAYAYPRHRDSLPSVSQRVGANASYWCANDVYAGGCQDATRGSAYPACFSSNATHIRYDPAGWAFFYERVYAMRARELDALLATFVTTFGLPPRLFLHGNSEGAMVVARYSHPALASLNLRGRILTAWSCEYVYFVSCPLHARLAQPTVPVLNLLSASDPFFAIEGSVASAVAAPGGGGYGRPLTGSCAHQMRLQGISGAAIRLTEPYHDTLPLSGSLYRHLVRRFVHDPDGAFRSGSVLAFEGHRLPSTLCQQELYHERVLSATCRSLLEFVEPRPPSTYNATACNWRSELVRPAFLDVDHTPPRCVGVVPAATPSPPLPSTFISSSLSRGEVALVGALAGSLVCVLGALGASTYVRLVHGYRLFFLLKEQGDEGRGGSDHTPAEASAQM